MGRFSTRMRRLVVVTGIAILFGMTTLIMPTSSALWQETLHGAGEIRINAFTSTPELIGTAALEETGTPESTFTPENKPTLTPTNTSIVPTDRKDEQPTTTLTPTLDDDDPGEEATPTATPTPPGPLASPMTNPEEMPSATPTELSTPASETTPQPTDILPVLKTPPIPYLLTQIPEWLKTPSPEN